MKFISNNKKENTEKSKPDDKKQSFLSLNFDKLYKHTNVLSIRAGGNRENHIKDATSVTNHNDEHVAKPINQLQLGVSKGFKFTVVAKLNKLSDSFLKFIESLGTFIISFIEYIIHKLDYVLYGIRSLTIKNIEAFINLKFHIVSKMIWSRGRLGMHVRYAFIFIFIFTVFLAGGIFQSKLIDENSTNNNAFLSSSQAILLETATAATLEGKSELLSGPIEHEVKDGETLNSIAKKYGIPPEYIKSANNLVYDRVKIGQTLQIPPVEGTLHTVKNGETIESIAKKYKVPSQSIVDYNYIDAPYTLTKGQVLTIPNAELPKKEKFYVGEPVYSTHAYGILPVTQHEVKGTGQFVWPFHGIISQGYHKYHHAIDIASNSGDIYAADKGLVVRAGWWKGGYGNAVQIDHGNGYVTTYAHMSSMAVSIGDKVERGQKIGVVGSTGRSTGPHVHFTVQKDGRYINPFTVLP